MTKVPQIKYQEVGNLYGLRNWVESGLKQSKNELGWADFRVTDYSRIERWWEMVMSAYLMVSLQSEVWGVGFGRELSRTGVGFYRFSGRSAKLSRVDGELVEPPWSIT